MPLPNTSPDMSPTPTTVKSSVWVSMPISRKWCLTRLPGAPGGDAHRLVVVADRAAGGERVAEPEPVVVGDAVGDVGERGGALVGGHHQVGVVAVAAHHRSGGTTAPVAASVVGDVEQSGDEHPVAGDALVAGGVAVGCGSPVGSGGFLTTKPPLAPTGTMTAFFTSCALTRPRISVRKSSRPVRPAQAAAGDLPEPQVHPLDPRRVDEDLELGPRQRQFVDQPGVQLHRHHAQAARRVRAG